MPTNSATKPPSNSTARPPVIRYTIAESPFGQLLIAATANGLCSVGIDSDARVLERELREKFPLASLQRQERELAGWAQAVLHHLQQPTHALNLPLDIHGTAFQQRVWQALREIPAGQTASYSDIAARIGQPTAVRAVASACASNPVAIAIPCHRVVRADGNLSGYRWGVERKRQLLEWEGALPSKMKHKK